MVFHFSFRARAFPYLCLLFGALHRNTDIIHETRAVFNAFFRQNAKLVKLAERHLFFCAKHTKFTPLSQQAEQKTKRKVFPSALNIIPILPIQ
jgi:hypothetical protein